MMIWFDVVNKSQLFDIEHADISCYVLAAQYEGNSGMYSMPQLAAFRRTIPAADRRSAFCDWSLDIEDRQLHSVTFYVCIRYDRRFWPGRVLRQFGRYTWFFLGAEPRLVRGPVLNSNERDQDLDYCDSMIRRQPEIFGR